MYRAQHVCARCPVAELCLWSALVVEDPLYRFGVYGGLLPQQRHQLAALFPSDHAAELLEVVPVTRPWPQDRWVLRISSDVLTSPQRRASQRGGIEHFVGIREL